MKTIRTSKFSKLLAFALCFLTVTGFYSCKREYTVGIKDKEVAAMSGEQIFKSVFFLEGSLTQKVDFLIEKREAASQAPLTGNDKKIKDQIVNETLEEIRRINPTYYLDLKEALIQHDHRELNTLLEQGAQMVSAALVKSPTMAKIMPQLKKLLGKLDLSKYNFQNQDDVTRFKGDVNKLMDENPGEFTTMDQDALAVTVFIVAAVAIVTVAVAVSWVGVAQVAGYVAAFVEVYGPSTTTAKTNDFMTQFESEILTKQLINVAQ